MERKRSPIVPAALALCLVQLLPASSAAMAEANDVDTSAAFATGFSEFDVQPGPHVLAEGAVDLRQIRAAPESAPADIVESLGRGRASYYANRFTGRPTASGERYDPDQLTAAHRTLPFGSLVRVTNPRNGQSVTVRINDRGPFHGRRVIDVSRAAAEELGLVRSGVGEVELELIATPN